MELKLLSELVSTLPDYGSNRTFMELKPGNCMPHVGKISLF